MKFNSKIIILLSVVGVVLITTILSIVLKKPETIFIFDDSTYVKAYTYSKNVSNDNGDYITSRYDSSDDTQLLELVKNLITELDSVENSKSLPMDDWEEYKYIELKTKLYQNTTDEDGNDSKKNYETWNLRIKYDCSTDTCSESTLVVYQRVDDELLGYTEKDVKWNTAVYYNKFADQLLALELFYDERE